jgi:hypothetical protein
MLLVEGNRTKGKTPRLISPGARLLRLELELRSPFGGLTANKKSVERLSLLAREALEEGGFPFGA